MKVISLNTWGGRAGKSELLSFFTAHAGTTDVFCLQEVWSEPQEHLEDHIFPEGSHSIMVYGRQEISAALPDHKAFYRPHHLDKFGLLMLVKKKHVVVDEGEVPIYKRHEGDVVDGDVGNHARNMQYAVLKTKSGRLTVFNFHGLWNGRGKEDCPERLEQSEKILNFTKKVDNPFVIVGDFSVLPDTVSIKMFEDAGLRNLVKEHKVLSTRTSLYSKPGSVSDYVFASKGVTITGFNVLPDEVSDHAPLSVEIR